MLLKLELRLLLMKCGVPVQDSVLAGDISNVYDVDRVFDSCVECFGRVDVLFQQHQHQGTNG